MRIACVQTRSFGAHIEAAAEFIRRIDRVAITKNIDVVVWPYGFIEDIAVTKRQGLDGDPFEVDDKLIEELANHTGVIKKVHIIPAVMSAHSMQVWRSYVVQNSQWERLKDIGYGQGGALVDTQETTITLDATHSLHTLLYSSPRQTLLSGLASFDLVIDFGIGGYEEFMAARKEPALTGLIPAVLGADISLANHSLATIVEPRSVGLVGRRSLIGGSIISLAKLGTFGLSNLEEALLICDSEAKTSESVELGPTICDILGQKHFALHAMGANLEVRLSQDVQDSTRQANDLLRNVELYNLHDALLAAISSYFAREQKVEAALALHYDAASLLTLELLVKTIGASHVHVLIADVAPDERQSLASFAKRLGVHDIVYAIDIPGLSSSLFADKPSFRKKLIEAALQEMQKAHLAALINCYTKTDVLLADLKATDHLQGFAPLGDVYATSVEMLLDELDGSFPIMQASGISFGNQLPVPVSSFAGTRADKVQLLDVCLGAVTCDLNGKDVVVPEEFFESVQSLLDTRDFATDAYGGDFVPLMSADGVANTLAAMRSLRAKAPLATYAPLSGGVVNSVEIDPQDVDDENDFPALFGNVAGIAAAFTTKDGKISSQMTNINLDDNKELSDLIEGLMLGSRDMEDPSFMNELQNALSDTFGAFTKDAGPIVSDESYLLDDAGALYKRRDGQGGFYFSEN